jgi:hypothetical protein
MGTSTKKTPSLRAKKPLVKKTPDAPKKSKVPCLLSTDTL